MTNEELTAIEARANAATRGPWETGTPYHHSGSESNEPLAVYGMGMEVADTQLVQDAAFIALSREAMPALIAEVRRLRALVESAYMEGAMANWDGHGVPAEYLPKDWAKSDARRALEVQP